jgi:FKBP-type peptidyl-prolyl cis-trans isomerase (trigger factor)
MEKFKIKIKKIKEWSYRENDWKNKITAEPESIKKFFKSKEFNKWYNNNSHKPSNVNKNIPNETVVDLFYNTKDEEMNALSFKNFMKTFSDCATIGGIE